MNVTVRTKQGKTIVVDKPTAKGMVDRGEAEYVEPHVPHKKPTGYQTR